MTFTQEEVVEAARALSADEFTRADIAGQLGVEKGDVKQGFNKARKTGAFEKTRDDDENTGHFRLT